MNQKTFSLIAGLIFSVITLMHVLRLALGWQVTLDGRTMPMWVSWAGVLVAGYLAYEGLRLSRRR